MAKFNENLKELREKRGLSQVDLADKLGTTRVSISQYENGKVTPDYERLILIADLFNVTTDYLLGRPNAEKHFFDKHTNETEDEILVHNYLKQTEALLREGNVTEENLRTTMKFMEFAFRSDLEEEKRNKNNS